MAPSLAAPAVTAPPTGPGDPPGPPLSGTDFRRLAQLSGRLPLAWTLSPRRRRLLVLGLAAPGFLLVFTTPFHRQLALLALGGVLFAAALLFRRVTEPVFASAEAAALWPPPADNPCPADAKEPHDA